MTREEAINHIKYGVIKNNYPLPKELGIEVFNMAIKALEQEPMLDKIRAEIETQEKWLAQAGYNAYNVDIAFNSIKLVLADGERGNNDTNKRGNRQRTSILSRGRRK